MFWIFQKEESCSYILTIVNFSYKRRKTEFFLPKSLFFEKVKLRWRLYQHCQLFPARIINHNWLTHHVLKAYSHIIMRVVLKHIYKSLDLIWMNMMSRVDRSRQLSNREEGSEIVIHSFVMKNSFDVDMTYCDSCKSASA
jgi:hypothetical protein